MLELGLAPPCVLCGVATAGKPQWVPVAHRRLHTELTLEGTQGRVRVERPVAPCSAGQAVLKEHADDGDHSQAAIRKLRAKLLLARLRIRHRPQEAQAKVALAVVAWLSRRNWLVDEELVGAQKGHDLDPAQAGYLGDGGEAVGHILEGQAALGRQESWKLEVFRHYETDAGQHADAAMLELGLATPRVHGSVATAGKSQWIPVAHRRLHTKLTLKGAQGRVRVERPVAPGSARQAVLKEHADDGDHCQAAVRKLRAQLLLARLRIRHRPQEAQAKVALAVVARLSGRDRLVDEELVGAQCGHNLDPAQAWYLGNGSEAV